MPRSSNTDRASREVVTGLGRVVPSVRERCIRQPVLTAARNVRFLSSQQKVGQSIVGNATESTESFSTNLYKPTRISSCKECFVEVKVAA